MGIVIVDCGIGNIGSIINMFRKIGVPSSASADPEVIDAAEKLILPGVGSFDHGMGCINDSGLRELLDKKALKDKIPVLGICLGMQLLTNGSEEGELPGLGWIDADTIKFTQPEAMQKPLKIPHMGWRHISPANRDGLFANYGDAVPRFYLVHSYRVVCAREEDVLATCQYGGEVTCAIQHDNVMGVQFHPEKSHRYGMQLFKNFAQM